MLIFLGILKYYHCDTVVSKLLLYLSLILLCNRSGDEKKEKVGEKTPETQNNGDHDTSGKNPKLVHLEINRGTAV